MADSSQYDQATLLRRQKIADAMLEDSRKAKPIRHWAEGVAQLADAGVAGYFSNKVDRQLEDADYNSTADLYRQAGQQPPPRKAAEMGGIEKLASLISGGGASAPATPAAESPVPITPAAVPSAPSAPPSPSDPRGFRNLNPGNIEDGPFARSQPGYAGSDGRFAKFATMENGTGAMGTLLDNYGKKGINTIAGMIGRWAPASDGNNVSAYANAVAKAAGVSPTEAIDLASNPELRAKVIGAMARHENGRPLPASLPAPQQGQAPYEVAGPPTAAPQTPVAQAMVPPTMPAPSGIFSNVPKEQIPGILQGLTSKNPTVRAIATQQLGNYSKADAPTDEIKEYKLDSDQRKARGEQPLSFFDFKSGLKKAGATNVTTNVGKDEEAFDKEAGKIVAGRFNDLAAEGPQAKQMISDVQTLQQLGTQIGTGKAAQAKATLGPYAEALGVKIDGLSDIQAYEAVVNRLAPNLRVKGSGAQSDLELKNFLKSLPSLGNTPGGNELISKTMEGLAANKAKAAEIGSMALNKEITRKEAEKQLRELPDPMQGWRDAQKAAKPAAAPEAAAPDRSAIEAEMKRRGLLK